MKIAIVDDNPVIANDVLERLQKLMGQKQAEYRVFVSGDEYLTSGYEPDYLFLDIEMPGSDGISVKEETEKRGSDTKIVFLTSVESRMREAFGKGVIGFLSKPLNSDELEKVVRKFEKPVEETFFEFDLGEQHMVIPLESILFIEASDKYTFLNTKKKERYCLRKSMKEWLDELPTDLFCRINKSYIINYELCNKSLYEISLPDKRVTKVSRIHREQLKQGYSKYLRKEMSGE